MTLPLCIAGCLRNLCLYNCMQDLTKSRHPFAVQRKREVAQKVKDFSEGIKHHNMATHQHAHASAKSQASNHDVHKTLQATELDRHDDTPQDHLGGDVHAKARSTVRAASPTRGADETPMEVASVLISPAVTTGSEPQQHAST